jgi:hypothetical protein
MVHQAVQVAVVAQVVRVMVLAVRELQVKEMREELVEVHSGQVAVEVAQAV